MRSAPGLSLLIRWTFELTPPLSAFHTEHNPDVSPTLKNGKRSKLSNFFRWFKGVEGMFALRHAVVSMALWIIAVHPTTAAFNYRNRGLWALIMAQTGLGVYAGDQ